MNSWMKLGGSVVLATLLLSGCGDSNSNENEAAPTTNTQDGSATDGSTTDTTAKTQTELENEKRAQTLFATLDADGLTKIEKIKIASGEYQNSVETFMTKFINDSVESGAITREAADEILEGDLNAAYIELITLASAPDSETNAKQRGLLDGLTQGIKDLLNDALASSLGQSVGGAAFELVLDSDGITVVMLDMARDSRTVTDAMIDILGDQGNWNDVTPKMYPLLRENTEFGEKFAALAYEMNPETKDGAPAMGRFFFSMVDREMYGALADAMVLSDDDAVHDESVSMSTTGYMGKMMVRHAKQFFIAPGTGVQADLSTASGNTYGSTDAFANLMFDTGAPVTMDDNGTVSGHGDASELQNERFFHAMFRTPTATGDFVDAMKQLDQSTVNMFMDQIFLGQSTDANVSADNIQGYYNIISIAGSMNEGIANYGMTAYYDGFIGFYGLVPVEKFGPYGLAFMNAGFHYMGVNDIDIWGGVSETAKGYYEDFVAQYLGGEDTNATTDENVSAAPAFRAEGLGTYDTSWSGVIYDCSGKGWEQVSIWDSITGAVTGLFEDDNTTAEDVNSTELGAMDTFSVCLHDEIELAVREDIVNDSKLDENVSTDKTMDEAIAEFTLPSFTDITFKYIYTGAYDRAAQTANFFYDSTLGDLSDWWTDFSIIDSATGAYEYTKGFVWDSETGDWATSEQRWAYFPNWLANTQWYDLEAYYADSTSTLTVDFDAGYVDFYVVSRDANLTTTAAGLSETMTLVDTDDLPLSVHKDLNIDDIADEDITEFYVYTIRIYSTTGLDELLQQLKDYISGFGADTTNAEGGDNNNTTE